MVACPLAARADLRDTLNWARDRGCAAVTPRAAGPRPELRDSPRLHEAAHLLMNGDSLPVALARAGYRAARSSAVHLSGAVSDAQVAHTLSASDCAILSEPRFSEVGAERRGHDVWMVLAAPLAVPNPGTAPAVSLRESPAWSMPLAPAAAAAAPSTSLARRRSSSTRH